MALNKSCPPPPNIVALPRPPQNNDRFIILATTVLPPHCQETESDTQSYLFTSVIKISLPLRLVTLTEVAEISSN